MPTKCVPICSQFSISFLFTQDTLVLGCFRSVSQPTRRETRAGADQTASAFHMPSVPLKTPYTEPQCYKSLLQEMVLLPWESPSQGSDASRWFSVPPQAPGPSAELGWGDSVGWVLFRAPHAAQQLKEKESHGMNFCLQSKMLEKARWKRKAEIVGF